jgi:hypothetical protein
LMVGFIFFLPCLDQAVNGLFFEAFSVFEHCVQRKGLDYITKYELSNFEL